MPGCPVRLVIASPDLDLTRGLSQLLAGHRDRVVVVEPDGAGEPADVVLHDTGDGRSRAEVLRRTGAAGWVPLHRGVEHILDLVEAAAGRGIDDSGRGASAEQDVHEPALSPRELEVLALIAEGLTNQQIADRACVSINSVKTYIRSAYRKIGVTSRSQAVVWGLRNGVVTPDGGAR